MKQHSVNAIDNFIGGWYIDGKVCDNLIDYFNNNKHHHKVGSTSNGVDVKSKISTDLPILKVDNDTNPYFDSLQKCVEQYINKYPYCNYYGSWAIRELVNIQYYKPNEGALRFHTERGFLNTSHRHLVFMTYLNDVDDAGETEFVHQKMKIKPEKGLTLIWPTDWTFTHRGIPSPSQEKYIITGWFSFTE